MLPSIFSHPIIIIIILFIPFHPSHSIHSNDPITLLSFHLSHPLYIIPSIPFILHLISSYPFVHPSFITLFIPSIHPSVHPITIIVILCWFVLVAAHSIKHVTMNLLKQEIHLHLIEFQANDFL